MSDDAGGPEIGPIEATVYGAIALILFGFIGLPYLLTQGESAGSAWEKVGLVLLVLAVVLIVGGGLYLRDRQRRVADAAARAYRGHDDI